MVGITGENLLYLAKTLAPLPDMVFSSDHLAGTQLFANRISRSAVAGFGIRPVEFFDYPARLVSGGFVQQTFACTPDFRR